MTLPEGWSESVSCIFCDEWKLNTSRWWQWRWVAHLRFLRHRDRDHRAEYLAWKAKRDTSSR